MLVKAGSGAGVGLEVGAIRLTSLLRQTGAKTNSGVDSEAGHK